MRQDVEDYSTLEGLCKVYHSKFHEDPELPSPERESEWMAFMEVYLRNSSNSMGWAHNVCSVTRRLMRLCTPAGGVLPSDSAELQRVLSHLLASMPTSSRLVCGDEVLLGLISSRLLTVLPPPHHLNGAAGVGPYRSRSAAKWGLVRRKKFVEEDRVRLVLVEYAAGLMLSSGVGERVPDDCMWVYPPSRSGMNEPDSWEDTAPCERFQIMPSPVLALTQSQQEVYTTLRTDGMQGPEALELAELL